MIYKLPHKEPFGTWLSFILLPLGEYYKPTKQIATAKKGDTLRFFNGADRQIEKVIRLTDMQLIDMLCRTRYGIGWNAVLKKWQSNAIIQGNGKEVISMCECLVVFYLA